MTIVKQKAVAHENHANNLRDYINSDKALMRDTMNIAEGVDWYEEMDEIREAFGHNTPAREGARNVTLYHQIIAFLPEEADFNGGKLSPTDCLKYARQYAERRYPNQQIVFALHREHCKVDNTDRYAVHMAINRTNLDTGNRLDEGPSRIAKIDRANTIRKLDEEWGLQQVERDKPNSKLHARQPRGAEKEITERGQKSYKNNLRLWCDYAEKKSANLEQFCQLLESVGYRVTTTDNKVFAVDLDNQTNKQGQQIAFNLSKLDGRFSKPSLEQTFETPILVRDIKREIEQKEQKAQRLEQLKSNYQDALQQSYQKYKQSTAELKGTTLKDIPAFRPPRPPQELQDDTHTKQLLLDYRNRANRLRNRLASDVAAAQVQKSKQSAKTYQQTRVRAAEQPTKTPGQEH